MEMNGAANGDNSNNDTENGSLSTNLMALYEDNKVDTSIEPSIEVDPVQLQFELKQRLKHLNIQDNIMYLVLEKLIYKIDLNSPAVVKLFQFAHDSFITNSWLSPNGQHFIVQINNSIYYYLHKSYDKFKILPRFKNLEISEIVFPHWKEDGYIESSGEFFIITKDNSIYISNIKSHFGQENKKDDKYVKLVYTSQDSNIIDICMSNNNTRIELLTNHLILTWDCFELSYNELVKVFKTNPTVTSLKLNNNDLILETSINTYLLISPQTNEIVSNDEELCLSQCNKLNPFSKLSNSKHSLVITNHHILALSTDQKHLVMFSKLSNSPPKMIELPEKVNGLTADYNQYTFWLFSKDNIYEIIINNESINVWYDYYKMGKYQEALTVLKSEPNSFYKKDMITIKQGYDYLQKGAFGLNLKDAFDSSLLDLQIKGIKNLGKSSEPFEKICLMLINLQSKESSHLNDLVSQTLLVEYLLVKYNYIKSHDKNKIKIVILSSWIIELMLRKIYDLSSEDKLLDVKQAGSTPEDMKTTYLEKFNKQLDDFLSNNYNDFDKPTIYQIIKNLNDIPRLIYFAELNKDYEFILRHYIELEDWPNALKVIIKIYSTNDPAFSSILSKTSTVLLLNYPKETVETWLKFSNIDYSSLLRSILMYNAKFKNIAIIDNYSVILLQKIIYNKGVKSKSINNYYLSLLISYKSLNDEETSFVNKQILKFLNFIKLDPKLYDSGLILRLCLDNKHIQPAIIILINDLKSFDQALALATSSKLTDLAIYVLDKFDKYISAEEEEIDKDLGDKSFINISKNKFHHRDFPKGKKLWLLFAKYLIDGVVNGEKFDILDDIETEENEEDPNGKPPTDEQLQQVSDALEGNLSVNSENANKVLKYLLELSYSRSINASFLNLKDLLELFPETIMVNNFKDEIIRSLNQYNNNINQLTNEMKESLMVSNKLNGQINESNKQINKGKIYTIIEPGEPCKLCNSLLINKNFLTFPNCHHSFHKECLIKYYLMVKNDYRFKKFFDTFKKTNGGNKKELDAIMLKECVLCSESNILNIDNTLMDPNKDKALIEEWVL